MVAAESPAEAAHRPACDRRAHSRFLAEGREGLFVAFKRASVAQLLPFYNVQYSSLASSRDSGD